MESLFIVARTFMHFKTVHRVPENVATLEFKSRGRKKNLYSSTTQFVIALVFKQAFPQLMPINEALSIISWLQIKFFHWVVCRTPDVLRMLAH